MIAARDEFEFTEAPTEDVGASFIFPPTERNLAVAARVIQSGGLIAIPTETVYGLAADALNETACRKIFELKGRPLIDPLIVHVHCLEEARNLARWNAAADTLASNFMPGPLTLILEKKACVPDIVTAGKSSVAIRLPNHPDFRAFSERTSAPLAAPSANPFGYVSPSKAEHVLKSFPKVGLPILQGGPCSIGIESTIVDVRDPSKPRLLRSGDIRRSQLEEALGRRIEDMTALKLERPTGPLSAPGSLARHYSPTTPTFLVERSKLEQTKTPHQARVYFEKPASTFCSQGVYWLSEANSAQEAQRNLYHLLRLLDEDESVDQILIETPESNDSNSALLDRLRRAAEK